jgi:hypothetical protein
MPGTHDKIIANAARKALQPLGLRRKGQSRLWFADHGWWLTVIEFQPSGLRKGSYLNVAAHWLWSDGGYISFDLGGGADWGSRVAEFEAYESDDQFQAGADRLADRAAQEAPRLALRIPSIDRAADLLLSHENGLPAQSRGSWSAYHAGVAAGLAGRRPEAETMLRSVTDDRVTDAAARFVEALGDAARFNAVASSLIATQRKSLGLPEVSLSQF